MTRWLIAFGICLAAVPASALLALAMVPLWRRIEAGTGLEAIGHSGPAGWCFAATYLLVVIAGLGAWRRLRGRDDRR